MVLQKLWKLRFPALLYQTVVRPPEGLTGKLWDLMPPPPPEGYGYLYARLNAIVACHAELARIKHLSLTDLEIGAIIVDPLG